MSDSNIPCLLGKANPMAGPSRGAVDLLVMGEQAASSVESRKPRGWRWVWRVARIGVLVYLGLVFAFYALQTWMIFPGHASQGQRSAQVRANGDIELLSLRTQSGQRVAAMFGKALSPSGQPLEGPRATVIYFYGNGMSMADCFGEMKQLRRLGCNVIVPEYLGYGMSEGEPGEEECYATADAAYDYLLTRGDIDPARIVPAGWSLGAAVAIDLAWRRPAQGVMAFSAFTSMVELGKSMLPFLPASLLVEHRFESRRKVSEMKLPLLVCHGQWDSIVPFEMADALAGAAAGPVTRWSVPADHNNLFDVGGEALWQKVGMFLQRLEEKGEQ